MMKPTFPLALILPVMAMLTVAGCASQHAMEDVAAACQAKGMRCARNHPSFSKMSDDAQRMVTYGAMIEEQRNAGKITPAQADFLMREFIAKLDAQQAARSQAASNAMGQAGATLLAIDAMNRNNGGTIYAPPPPMSPMMRTTNCNALGGRVTCTSF
jgi:hypothetical protein